MKAVAVIPARGGSKRVPRKNLAIVEGKPLLSWVLDTVIESAQFDEVFVSSEDAEILSIARQSGASPHVRPLTLADDFTHVGPVVDECIESQGLNPVSVCLVYATALLLEPAHLQGAAALIRQKDVQSVLAITEYSSPIQRAYVRQEDGSIAMERQEFFNWRSQDLPPRFRDAGMFSWWKRKAIAGDRFGYIVPKSSAVDIDTHEDLEIAKALFSFKKRRQYSAVSNPMTPLI